MSIAASDQCSSEALTALRESVVARHTSLEAIIAAVSSYCERYSGICGLMTCTTASLLTVQHSYRLYRAV